MKSKKVIRWIDAGIWPCSLVISFGFSYDEINKHLKKVKANGWLTAISEDRKLIEQCKYLALKRTITNTKTGQEQTYFFIIFKHPFEFTDYGYSTLAHEIHHICTFMLSDILDIKNEYEAVAYTHTYFMENILKILREK